MASVTKFSINQFHGYLPDRATYFRLVFREVNVLKDHVLAIPDEVFIILVSEVAAVGLTVVKGGAAVFSVVFQLFVDHIIC